MTISSNIPRSFLIILLLLSGLLFYLGFNSSEPELRGIGIAGGIILAIIAIKAYGYGKGVSAMNTRDIERSSSWEGRKGRR